MKSEMQKIMFEMENDFQNMKLKLSNLRRLIYKLDESRPLASCTCSFSYLKPYEENVTCSFSSLKHEKDEINQEPIDYKKVRDELYKERMFHLIKDCILKDEKELSKIESELEEAKNPKEILHVRPSICKHNPPNFVQVLTKRKEELLKTIKTNKDYRDKLERDRDS